MSPFAGFSFPRDHTALTRASFVHRLFSLFFVSALCYCFVASAAVGADLAGTEEQAVSHVATTSRNHSSDAVIETDKPTINAAENASNVEEPTHVNELSKRQWVSWAMKELHVSGMSPVLLKLNTFVTGGQDTARYALAFMKVLAGFPEQEVLDSLGQLSTDMEAMLLIGYHHWKKDDCSSAAKYYRQTSENAVHWAAGNSKTDWHDKWLIEEMEFGGGWHEHGMQFLKNETQSLEDRATNGDMWAKAQLGWRKLQGLGTDKDEQGAHKDLHSAHSQGDAMATYNIGWMHYTGNGVPHNFSKAVHYFKQAAHMGSSAGANAVGLMYLNGFHVQQNVTEALVYIRLASDLWLTEATFNLAMISLYGVSGAPVNYTLGMEMLEECVRRRHYRAKNLLGEVHLMGIGGIPQNCTLAVSLFKDTVDHWGISSYLVDHAQRAWSAGNLTEAVALYWEAAEMGQPIAQANMAHICVHHRDALYPEAYPNAPAMHIRYLTAAADQQHEPSVLTLGTSLFFGTAPFARNYTKAIPYLRRASQTSIAASFYLSWAFQMSYGVNGTVHDAASHAANAFYLMGQSMLTSASSSFTLAITMATGVVRAVASFVTSASWLSQFQLYEAPVHAGNT